MLMRMDEEGDNKGDDEGGDEGGQFSPNERRQSSRPGVKPSKVGDTWPGVVAGCQIVYHFAKNNDCEKCQA